MNRSLFDKISGIKYDPVRYRGLPGKVRYFAIAYSTVIMLIYVLLTAGILPLYIRGYESLGNSKSNFWIMNYELCGKLLLAAPIFIFFAFILGVIAYYDSEEETGSLMGSGYIISGYYTGEGSTIYIWPMLFMLCVALSFFLSDLKTIALAGEDGWNCGMQQYMAVGICFLLIVLLKMKYTFFLIVAMLSSFTVNVIGLVMDIFGNVFGLAGWNENKVSTIGNPNWYCGYIVTVFFLGIALYYTRSDKGQVKDRINTVFLALYISVGAYMYVAQGSMSGFVALYAVFLTLLIISGKNLKKLLRVSEIFVIFSSGLFVCSLVTLLTDYVRANDDISMIITGIPFSTTVLLASVLWMLSVRIRIKKGREKALFPIGRVIGILTAVSLVLFTVLIIVNTSAGGRFFGKGILFFGPYWGSNRGMTVSVGVRMFREMTIGEKLFGTGPDTFYALLTGGRFLTLAGECNRHFNGARLTNAHCEPLTLLINIGVFGTVCFFGMLITVFVKAMKNALIPPVYDGDCNAVKEDVSGKGFVLGVSLCIMAYIVNNLFSFETVMNLSQLSFILGFGASAMLNGKTEE